MKNIGKVVWGFLKTEREEEEREREIKDTKGSCSSSAEGIPTFRNRVGFQSTPNIYYPNVNKRIIIPHSCWPGNSVRVEIGFAQW